MKKSQILLAILFNTVVAAFVAPMINVPILPAVIVWNLVAFTPQILYSLGFIRDISRASGLFAGLNKEIWLSEFKDKFRTDDSFLKEASDYSPYVMNDIINLAEAGADPQIVTNYNGAAPLPVSNNEDTPIAMALMKFSSSRERYTVELESTRSYDILKTRVARHLATMQEQIARYAANVYTPSANAANTPIITATGAADVLYGSTKKLRLEDIVTLSLRLNELNVPLGKRILVLSPRHFADLQAQDMLLFKSISSLSLKQGFPLLDFTCYVSTATPTFNKSTLVKNVYGAAAVPATDTQCSFAFEQNEVAKAFGTTKFYGRMADPEYQSNEFNFSQRFLAQSIRNKGMAAVVSN